MTLLKSPHPVPLQVLCSSWSRFRTPSNLQRDAFSGVSPSQPATSCLGVAGEVQAPSSSGRRSRTCLSPLGAGLGLAAPALRRSEAGSPPAARPHLLPAAAAQPHHII